MDYSILCIFALSGKTYTFTNVKMFSDDGAELRFRHTAETDGKIATATFMKTNLCGWSTTSELPLDQPFEAIRELSRAYLWK